MPPPPDPGRIAPGLNFGTSSSRSVNPLTTMGVRLDSSAFKGFLGQLTQADKLFSSILKSVQGINSVGRGLGNVFGSMFGGIFGGRSTTNTMAHLQNRFVAPGAGLAGRATTPGGTPLDNSQASQIARAQAQSQAQTQARVGTSTATAPGAVPTMTAALASKVSALGKPPAPVRTGTTPPPNQPPDGGGGGGPPSTPPSTMPWLRTVGIAAMGFGMFRNRFMSVMQESIPLSAQNTLMASMYGMNYRNIEMNRMQALGPYGGTRQDAAAAQGMALAYGQTPLQAQRYLQGVGRTVQAMGGTMTAPQAVQAMGGFLDPMVLRRQQAMGIPMARIGGQVRDLEDVAQDYINHYQRVFNRGVKLNEFDFINLGIPGSLLRITFQNMYNLDDSAIDSVIRVGMQQVQAGGRINYNSQASMSAAGLGNQKLGLKAQETATVAARRNATYARSQEGAMVGWMETEQDVQEALGRLEEGTSALTSAFGRLERVVGGVITGFMVLGGMGAMGGMGMGGGGMLMAGGGGGAAAGVAGAAGTATAVGGARGLLGRLASGRGMAGAALGVYGVQQAVNAVNWGDVFKSAGAGAGAGFLLSGSPWGAAIGAALTGGPALINMLTEGGQQEREAAAAAGSQSASNMTDTEIINQIQAEWARRNGTGASAPSLDWKELSQTSASEGASGPRNRFLIRRSALIADFMAGLETRDPDAFLAYMEYLARVRDGADPDNPTEFRAAVDKVIGEWVGIENRFADFASTPNNVVDADSYVEAGEQFLELTKRFRAPGERRNLTRAGAGAAYDSLNKTYLEYFGDMRHPLEFEAVNTQYARDIISRYSFSPLDLATANNPNTTGDPPDNGSTDTSFTPFNLPANAPLAEEPSSDETWTKLDPRMKKRLRALFSAAKGKVGFGGGWRSTERQRSEFFVRHREDPNGKIEFEGKRYSLRPGFAAWAPPGRSMHEIGLAADLTGSAVGGQGWTELLRRFGLKHFGPSGEDVNNEPWHVQLIEFPNSRREYEKGGFADYETTTTQEGTATESAEHAVGGGGGGGISGVGYSSAAMIGGFSSRAALAAGAPRGGGGAVSFEGTGGATTEAATSVDTTYSGGGNVEPAKIYAYLVSKGVSPASAAGILANIQFESGFSTLAVGDHGTSGGLFQHHEGRWDNLKKYAASTDREWDDWTAQVDFALQEARDYGINLNHDDPKAAAREWTLKFERPRNAAQRANERAAVAPNYMNIGDAAFDPREAQGFVGGLHVWSPDGQQGDGSFAERIGSAALRGARSGARSGLPPINVNVTINSKGNYSYDAAQLAKAVRPAFEREYAEVTAKRST